MQKIICLIALLLFSNSAIARQHLKWEFPKHPHPSFNTIYQISGRNNSTIPVPIIIRIDDTPSPDYAHRVNEERWVLPGPFNITIQPASLQTPRNNFLDLDEITQLIVFSENDVFFERMEEIEAKPLTSSNNKAIIAYDFGGKNSPVYPGFQKIDENSTLFKNTKPAPFIRKSSDSLIRDGLKNVTQIEMPLANGNWRVHLWTEDIGEWETLPPLYERRIRINSIDMSITRRNNIEWIEQRYLAGNSRDKNTSPWHAFGEYRGGLSSHTVKIDHNILRIDFAGSNSQATTLTAMLIEEVEENDKAFNTIQNTRQEWFAQKWPYIDSRSNQLPTKLIHAFAGETLFLPLKIGAPVENIEANTINIIPLYSDPTFQRSTPNSGLLERNHYIFSPDRKLGSVKNMLSVDIPDTAHSGYYPINIRYKNSQNDEIKIYVVDFKKPKLNKSIGIYLEPAPHFKNPLKIEQQIWCDLDFIDQLGFTAVAPPFRNQLEYFLEDLTRANSFGFRDILSYTTLKQIDKNSLKILLATLDSDHFKQPIWSIADEPSNAGQAQELKKHAKFLQSTSHFAKKAGHLNSNKDLKFLKYFDLALINNGFGLNLNAIQTLKEARIIPWFYNMENRRLAAGFYLWRMQMDGYLQWHGRMPTADPFDPTDGREDDVQLIYPSLQPCTAHPDIDIKLIEMVNGLSDLRWLIWLDEFAKKNQESHDLRKEIMREIPTDWQKVRTLNPAHWDLLKSRIQDLAFRLQN